MHAPRKEQWQEKIKRSRYLIGAIVFHLILFFMIATLVIWPAPPPSLTAEFQRVTIKTPPPPPPPPAESSPAASNPEVAPTQVVVPVVTPPSVITTVNDAFKIDAPPMPEEMPHNLNNQMAQPGLGSGLNDSGGVGPGFGSSNGSGNQFKGYFYDLKQTPDRKPTNMSYDNFYRVLGDYILTWDDSILAKYYKTKAPLFTNSFIIPSRLSEQAPKAFHVENEVQPSLWTARYQAKVVAPTGQYRFIGYGDNVLVVRINNRIVLDAGYNPLTNESDLHESYLSEDGWDRTDPNNPKKLLSSGKKFYMDSETPVKMDVLLADDGGKCAFYLLIEKVGGTYEKLQNGVEKLPYFQLNSDQPPRFSSEDETPPYSHTPEPWQGVADSTSADGASADGN
jgi:hypothetical protein